MEKEQEVVLGLTVLQIAWMKKYFIKNLIEIESIPLAEARLQKTYKKQNG